MTKHLYLIDGSGFIFRAYYGYPRMHRRDGTAVNAVYGFCVMINKLIRETDADFVGVIFDTSRTTFRNDIYPPYKANRDDIPEDLKPQFALIRQACEAYNIPSIAMPGFEADDLIASYAKTATAQGFEVSIVSSDKDLMQLVNDSVTMYDSMKNKTISRDQVFEKFGVYPERVVDVQSLSGDPSDNVPGIPGIGIKTASLLINEYGDLDTLLARAGEVRQNKRRENLIKHADDARLSRQLVTLKDDIPLPEQIGFFARRDYDVTTLRAYLTENNFKRLLAVLDKDTATATDTETDTETETDTTTDTTTDTATETTTTIAMAPDQQDTFVVPESLKTVTYTYVCIQDVDTLKAWLQPVYTTGVLAIDTETTGLHIRKAKIVGISLATDVGRACYIPLNHRTNGQTESTTAPNFGEGDIGDLFCSDYLANRPRQITPAELRSILQPILSDPSINKVGHNLKFDMSMLEQVGLSLYPVDDTMVMSFCVDAGRQKHGLDTLADRYFNHKMIAYRDVCGTGRAAKKFDTVDLQDATVYAAEDADITWRLYRILKQRLVTEKGLSIYADMERRLIPVITQMEQNGILVDPVRLESLSNLFGGYMHDAERTVMDIVSVYDAPVDFNLASPSQLGAILFDTIGIPNGKKTKTGAYSTSSEVLAGLELHDPIHKNLIQSILTYRTYAKLKSTYTDALQDEISPITGRVHTSFNMVGTITGRFSSSDPNLQNIPVRGEEGKRIRECFVADKNNILISLDYSQIELRIIAHIADDPTMIQAFRDHIDIHQASASKMFGIPLEQVDETLRRKAKIINFGIIYDVSAFGLAQQVGCSRTEAAQFIKEYFEQFPNIQQYMETIKQNADIDGFVCTLFNRKIHLHGLHGTGYARAHAFRQAINAPIQGTSADIIKRAMIKIHTLLQQNPIGKMILQVHDELLFETTPENADKLTAMVTEIMETAHQPIVDLKVPLVVQGKKASNWAEAH